MQFDELSNRLKGIEDASWKGYPIKDLYRLMCKMPEIWQEAYANIYSNKGAITKGVNDNTLDSFSMERVEGIIQALKEQRYKFKPVRRVYIPKKNGKKRPLGITTGDDKLVQEVVRIILERIYEPNFSEYSHGFRLNRSCHTALEQVRKSWKGVKWFVKIDILGFFDNLNHKILIELLKKKIKDKGFIVLIKDMLKAGVLSEWRYHNTYSGVPQGGTASPMLANVYGHELDQFIEKLINEFNVGKRRPANLEYQRLANKKRRIRKTIDKSEKTDELIKELHELSRRMKEIPSKKTHGDDYKRLRYCRYADDFILGIIGTKEDAKEINEKVVHFLAEKLCLKISQEKSGIFSAKKGIKFLNYRIHTDKGDKTLRMKINGRYTTKRTITEHISLHVPQQRIIDFCAKHEYGDWYKNEPKDKPKLLNASDVEILYTYNAELRGLANYYCLADDVKRKLSKLFYLAEYSLVKTLANKHKAKQKTIHKRLKKGNELILRYDVNGREKEITLFKLKHMTKKPKSWDVDQITNTLYLRGSDSELVKRMNANECEYCGRTDLPIQIHHVGKLKDIRSNKNKEKWQKVMIASFLCSGTKDSCHYLLHRGKLPDNRFNHPWTFTKWT